MLGLSKRKKIDMNPMDYRKAVIRILKEDGFNPVWLNSLLPGGTVKVDRLYSMLQAKELDPPEAAKAIEVGTHFFNEKKEKSEESDWPLKYTDKIPDEYSRKECYYLEQITEAVTRIVKKRKKSLVSSLGFGK